MNQNILEYLKKWEPISDRVLVLPEEKIMDAEIYVSETRQGEDKQLIATILAVGKGRYGEDGKLIPMQLKVGQKVALGKYSGDDRLINEDLTMEHYDGVKRDDQVFVTILRADSLLSILP